MIDAPATVITPIEQAEAFVAATEGVQSRFLVEKLQGFGDDVKTDGSSIMRSALQCAPKTEDISLTSVTQSTQPHLRFPGR